MYPTPDLLPAGALKRVCYAVHQGRLLLLIIRKSANRDPVCEGEYSIGQAALFSDMSV